MSVLICGSLAYDTIMRFDDKFDNHILPDKIHILSVSFLTSHMRREFGGCAGNIAYNLNLLDVPCQPMGTVGRDFGDYAAWMECQGISQDRILQLDDIYTSQAYITTDNQDNQITAFYPGAMDQCHQQVIASDCVAKVGVVAPEGRLGMLQHAEQMVAAGIPFLFDPGQGMPLFKREEFLSFVEQATWAAFNDYEAQMMKEKSGLSLAQLSERLQAVVVTRGPEGSHIYQAGKPRVEIPVLPATQMVDPTGCGDAYRGGLLYGLLHDMDWETSGRIASLMGSIKVEQEGTQNHSITIEELRERFAAAFGYSLD